MKKTRGTLPVIFMLPEIRRKLKLTQKDIAELFGVTVITIQGWERGRKHPSGTSLRLLSILAMDPVSTIALLKKSRNYLFSCSKNQRRSHG